MKKSELLVRLENAEQAVLSLATVLEYGLDHPKIGDYGTARAIEKVGEEFYISIESNGGNPLERLVHNNNEPFVVGDK